MSEIRPAVIFQNSYFLSRMIASSFGLGEPVLGTVHFQGGFTSRLVFSKDLRTKLKDTQTLYRIEGSTVTRDARFFLHLGKLDAPHEVQLSIPAETYFNDYEDYEQRDRTSRAPGCRDVEELEFIVRHK